MPPHPERGIVASPGDQNERTAIMRTNTHNKNTLQIITLSFVVMSSIVLFVMISNRSIDKNTNVTATNFNVYPQTIYNEDDAISWAITMLPGGFITDTISAKLISGQKFDAWRGVVVATLGRSSPVWLVVATGTIAGTPASINDISQFDTESDTREIDGVFYAYEANNGHLVGSGAVGDQWNQNLSTFASLQEDTIAIVTPSVEPSETPITSTPVNPE